MKWYALRSKPNREEALCREVDSRGYLTFYPRLQVRPANPRARKIRPYFPGYLFVQANLLQVGLSIFSWLPYSRGLVCFGGEPAEVPEVLIQGIRRRVNEVNAEGSEQLLDFKPGDTVIMQEGPFAGYKAVFDARLKGTQRVRVLLELLQVPQVRLELPAWQVQPAERR
jgi:transcriptional antiterminator RfaH